MATVELTKDNFVEVAKDNSIVVVDFWAAWCPPCRQFAPIFERVSERHHDVVFGKVDTEAQPELSQAYEISSIPTVMFVKDQVIVHQQPGLLPADALDQLVGQVRGLDMDDVRANVAAQQ